MKYFIAVLFLLVPTLARGDIPCPDGEVLVGNDKCEICRSGFYCPGGWSGELPCPGYAYKTVSAWLADCGLHDVSTFVSQLTDTASWGSTTVGAASEDDCVAVSTRAGVSREGTFIIEAHYNSDNSKYWNDCQGSIWFYEANAGYYLSGYVNTTSKDWYDDTIRDWYVTAKPCTNAPENAHYTGAGTPDAIDGSFIDKNDCPWACDDGYVLRNGECVPLCTAGATKFHVGDYVFNIYAKKLTTPAINIGLGDNTVCYVPLVAGTGKGALNVDYHGTVYHTSN